MRAWLPPLLIAGSLTALVDGVFSSVLSAVFYGSTVQRLFQGVAATLLGPGALTGGTRTALIGVLMHVGVAFGLVGRVSRAVCELAMGSSGDDEQIRSVRRGSDLRAVRLAGDVARGHSRVDSSGYADRVPLVGPAVRAHSVRGSPDRRVDPRNIPVIGYSVRNTTSGSVRAARRAGR